MTKPYHPEWNDDQQDCGQSEGSMITGARTEQLFTHGYAFGHMSGIECEQCYQPFTGADGSTSCGVCARDNIIIDLQSTLAEWREDAALRDRAHESEVERLRGENEKLKGSLKDVCDNDLKLLCKNTRLHSRVARLRGVLDQIRDLTKIPTAEPEQVTGKVLCIADRALTTEQEKPDD